MPKLNTREARPLMPIGQVVIEYREEFLKEITSAIPVNTRSNKLTALLLIWRKFEWSG